MKGLLTMMIGGKTVKDIWKNDTEIMILYMDGTSHRIGWQDDHGNLIKGEPVMLSEGTHLIAKPPPTFSREKIFGGR